MGLRNLFGRGDRNHLSGAERRQYREHLAELDVLLEQGLEQLGARLAGMSRSGELDPQEIWDEAARLTAIEDEVRLVERGITERLTREQLQELARQEAAQSTEG